MILDTWIRTVTVKLLHTEYCFSKSLIQMLLDEKHEIRYHFISSLFFCNCYLRCFLVKQKFLCLWSCCIIFNILFTEGEQSMKNCPVAITSGAKSINNFDWAELPQSCDKKLLTRARGAAQPGSDWTMLNFLSSTPHHSLAGFMPLILILLGKINNHFISCNYLYLLFWVSPNILFNKEN